MKNHELGHKSLRSEQLLLATLIPRRSPEEVLVLHHVTDTPTKLQIELERRCPVNGVKFERVRL